jgi:hypothetical protein
MMTTTKTATPGKLLREWAGEIDVGIYENCTWSVRLYEDRAVIKMPGVRWTGNTGGYHLYRSRASVEQLRELRAVLADEQADGETYDDNLLERMAIKGLEL